MVIGPDYEDRLRACNIGMDTRLKMAKYKFEMWHIAIPAIAIILLSAYSQPQGMIQTWDETNPNVCEDARSGYIADDTYKCVGSCVHIDASIAECLDRCIWPDNPNAHFYNPDRLGEYRFFADQPECNTITDARALCEMECIGMNPSISCGNGACEVGETQSNCPIDCGGGVGGCGDGICEGAETSSNCPEDCSSNGNGDGFEFKMEYLLIGGAFLVLMMMMGGKKRRR